MILAQATLETYFATLVIHSPRSSTQPLGVSILLSAKPTPNNSEATFKPPSIAAARSMTDITRGTIIQFTMRLLMGQYPSDPNRRFFNRDPLPAPASPTRTPQKTLDYFAILSTFPCADRPFSPSSLGSSSFADPASPPSNPPRTIFTSLHSFPSPPELPLHQQFHPHTSSPHPPNSS